MNFGFFVDQDRTRYSHLRLRRLKGAIKDPKILDALVQELGITGENLTGVTAAKKRAAIERRIEELRGTKTSSWFGVPAPEVLAASIFKAARFAGGAVEDLFTSAREQEGLVGPVVTWMRGGGLTPMRNIPFGDASVDLAGYRKGFLSGARVVAIQVRNELGGLERALHEMKVFTPYTNATYLACTPALAAQYLTAHAARPGVALWDGGALLQELRASGSGLLLIERDALSEALLPKERTLDAKTLKDLAAMVAPP